MAADLKYGKVTFEKGDIGEDEPVFVFRAKDRLATSVINYYAELCEAMGSPAKHLSTLPDAITQFQEWQSNNRTQIPRSD